MYQTWRIKILYHHLAPLISKMMPLVICILSVTLASDAEIRGWLTSGMNFRWIRTSAAHDPQPNHLLLQYLLTQTARVLAVIFLFFQVKLAIPKGFNGKITPHLSAIPFGYLPDRTHQLSHHSSGCGRISKSLHTTWIKVWPWSITLRC